ncbi:unnamed protein product, partial [marine sediment metagenome]
MLGLVPSADDKIYSASLLMIHEFIFSDKPFAGKWREVDVTVGNHRPPKLVVVAELMEELKKKVEDASIATVKERKQILT